MTVTQKTEALAAIALWAMFACVVTAGIVAGLIAWLVERIRE